MAADYSGIVALLGLVLFLMLIKKFALLLLVGSLLLVFLAHLFPQDPAAQFLAVCVKAAIPPLAIIFCFKVLFFGRRGVR